MKAPTKDQIEKEIQTLKEMMPNVRKTSMFGDNHHDAIDAQVEVLKEDLDEDEIDQRYGGTDDETSAEKPLNVLESALDAFNWLSGEAKDPPSKEWKDLLINKAK